jgi:hypothetical protein
LINHPGKDHFQGNAMEGVIGMGRDHLHLLYEQGNRDAIVQWHGFHSIRVEKDPEFPKSGDFGLQIQGLTIDGKASYYPGGRVE